MAPENNNITTKFLEMGREFKLNSQNKLSLYENGHPRRKSMMGYVSCNRSGFDRGGFVEIKGAVQRSSLAWRYDLAKLNLKYHMNYSYYL